MKNYPNLSEFIQLYRVESTTNIEIGDLITIVSEEDKWEMTRIIWKENPEIDAASLP
jgi:hypothetical protein